MDEETSIPDRSGLVRTNRHSSLELRRLPVDTLLAPPSISDDQRSQTEVLSCGHPSASTFLSVLTRDDDKDNSKVNEGGFVGGVLLRKTCLNSKYTLRAQLMIIFGTMCAISILIVTVVCIIFSLSSGRLISRFTYNSFDEIVRETEGTTARYIAENLSPKLIPEDIANILYESVQDRFMGYPNHPGYDTDELVPFLDIESGTNKYPILGEPLPSYFVPPNVNEENYMEHVQHRYYWYNNVFMQQNVSTEAPMYFVQGACDPNIKDPTDWMYYPNCTEENNNMQTGGVVAPSPTNFQIHRKGSDLLPLLKSLYEYHQDAYAIGLYFVNDGSGSSFQFPSLESRTNLPTITYPSNGCDWLLNESHPLDPSRPIISDPTTRQRIENGDICRPKNTSVLIRHYNPLERGWFVDAALDPSKMYIEFIPSLEEGSPFISLVQSIYDRVTNELIGCLSVDFIVDSLQQILFDSRLTNESQVTIVRYDESGTVLASTAWAMTYEISTIDRINATGVSKRAYEQFYNLVDYSSYNEDEWDPTEIREIYEESILHVNFENGVGEEYLASAYPVPPPPVHYDSSYSPEFLILVAIPLEEAYEEVDDVDDAVASVVMDLIIVSVIIGAVGLVMILLAITFVSHSFTEPLRYMNDVSHDIIHHNFVGDGNNNIDDDQFDSSKFRNSTSSSTKAGEKMETAISNSNDEISTEKFEPENSKNLTPAQNTRKKEYKTYKPSKCVPRTEINEVASQFERMVSNFCGGSVAKSANYSLRELKNEFSLTKQFEKLYFGRYGDTNSNGNEGEEKIEGGGGRKTKQGEGKKFPYDFKGQEQAPGTYNSTCSKVHHGPISVRATNQEDEIVARKSFMGSKELLQRRRENGWSSSLFFWVVILTVIPLIITIVTMGGYVASTTYLRFTEISNEAKEAFLAYEINALQIYATRRADLSSALMARPVRDLYVLTRFSGWLLQGGVQPRPDTYTDMISNTEACKSYENIDDCPEFIETYVCDCSWGDKRGTCQNYDEMLESRYSQRSFFVSQSQDADPITGDRYTTSFPDVSNSPETTEWYTDGDMQRGLPGYVEGLPAEGYDTTYSRVRGLSAISALSQPLYNQDNGHNKIHLASFIASEADGTLMGYQGCAKPGHSNNARFRSSSINANLRPNICPEGKYGLDPRCQEWYDNGKTLYENNSSTILHVTPPFKFPTQDDFGQTATSPLTNPITGEYIGQTAVGFNMTPLLNSLSSQQTITHEGGFSLLITASNDFSVDDTVVGPDFSFEDPKPVIDVVLPNDDNCNSTSSRNQQERERCENHREAFLAIVDDMKSANRGFGRFMRTSSDGSSVEEFFIAYAPVKVRSFSPIDSSDFSRGVVESKYTIYSLAVAEPVEALVAPLNEMEEELDLYITIALIVLVVVICITSLSVIYISYRMALSISEPMLYLLELIGYINSLESYNNLLSADVNRRGHSLEVVNVSKTLESLYQVIRTANIAFFSGDLEQAYSDLRDVLRVYRKLSNKKGVSIACNNLGNVMLTAYRTMGESDDRFCDYTKQQLIIKGIKYFHESIQLGEKAYDTFYETQGWSPSCLEFMQHLSNRYFNRAMFLLTIKEKHENPTEIEELGLRDLKISYDMDLEIVEEGQQAGWGVTTVDKHFDVKLRRVRGIISLLEMGYNLEDYYVKEDYLDVLYKTLMDELKLHYGETIYSSPLFQEINPAGRMQQVETELIRYYMLNGDMSTAAKVAIRMFVEDEYILVDAQLKAGEALVHYIQTAEYKEESLSDDTTEIKLHEYQNSLKRRCVEYCSSLSKTSFRAGNNRSIEGQRGDVTMEAF